MKIERSGAAPRPVEVPGSGSSGPASLPASGSPAPEQDRFIHEECGLARGFQARREAAERAVELKEARRRKPPSRS
jgi:hypothetical protein